MHLLVHSEVRYGANGSYFYKTLSDGTACTNSVFGDPIFGVVKQCAIAAGASIDEWTFCAVENQTCAFTGTRRGAVWRERVLFLQDVVRRHAVYKRRVR